MTKERKYRLRCKIEASRGRLMEQMPLFGLLLMHLRFVAVPRMKKISTNGRCIFFSADFLDKLCEHELDYMLCHQILHIIYEDIWRPPDLGFANYHYACDLKLNDSLLENFSFERPMTHLGELLFRVPGIAARPKTMTREEICATLIFDIARFDEKTQNRFLVDSDRYWGDLSVDAEIGELILDPADTEYIDLLQRKIVVQGDDEGAEEKKKWRAHLIVDAQTVRKIEANRAPRQCGSIPGDVRRIIQNMHQPTLDWRKILNDFIREEICDYSFTPPDHRFGDFDFFLPGFNEKDFVTKDVLFMVDTSGSVDDGVLADVYSEIKAALEQFEGKLCGKLGFFDWDVKTVVPLQSVEDLGKTVPIGGGGTNFHSIFEYVATQYADNPPASILIFTDGEAAYPDESMAKEIPVMWILSQEKITPPWGRVVRVTQKNKKSS